MLKAIVNYSKKVPAETEYSSQGYSLSLETEIAAGDPASIQAQIHSAFLLVKASVEQELANGGVPANVPATASPATAAEDRSAERIERVERVDRIERKASNKQIGYINSLVSKKGVALSELTADIRRRFNAEGLYDLTAKQASAVIDEMNKISRTSRAA